MFLASHLPSLPLDVFARAWPPELHARAFVVDSGGHVPRVVACNDAARMLGVREGMLLSAAYALAPDLVQQPRDPVAEQAALEQLATFALAFTPTVSLVPPNALVVDIGGSLKLFGGLAKLGERVRQGIVARGFDARIGIAPTPIAALAFARAGSGQVVTETNRLAPALDRLPLDLFDIEADARATLASAGVRTFGEADRLPRDGLARRFGPALVTLLDRAAARQPDPRVAYEPPPQFAARLELPASVDDVQALGFAVNRLVHELASWLLSHGLGVTVLSLALSHERALVRRQDSPCTQARFALGAPSRTPKHLMHVLQERLARIALPAPVTAIALASESVATLSGRNLRLLPGDEGLVPEVPLVDRLRARLGESAVQRLVPHAEHRPELATRDGDIGPEATRASGSHAIPAATSATRGTKRRSGQPPAWPVAPRPVWLLAEPQPLADALSTRPWILREGPERIESGWWDGGDVRRDYYVAQTPQGGVVWIYRDHRYGTDDGEWFLHGVFA